jgi:hypothetical protein
LELGGKIVPELIHVNSDSDHGQVWRLVLCAHLHKHSGDLAPINLNVVRQFDRGFEAERDANYVRDSFDRPNREPS